MFTRRILDFDKSIKIGLDTLSREINYVWKNENAKRFDVKPELFPYETTLKF